MNCKDIVVLLSKYIDFQLDGYRRKFVDEHLKDCENCRKELFDLKASISALNELPAEEVDDSFNSRVMMSLDARKGIPLVVFRYALGFAIACMLLIVGIPTYVANMKNFASRQDIYVVGTGNMIPGSWASLRVVVANRSVQHPVKGAHVTLSLKGRGLIPVRLMSGDTDAEGTLNGSFLVPAVAAGKYEVVANVSSWMGRDKLDVPVEFKRAAKVMVTTDKPIYQPGQTIHIRALALLRPSLKPAAGDNLRFVIEDPSGNKICDETRANSEWGISAIDFQLADEIGLGTYNIKVVLGDTATYMTVTVKRYVLPKFKVTLKTDRTYYLPGQVVKGTVSAAYFFGKTAANASVTVDLSAYSVTLDKFAQVKGRTNARGEFAFQARIPNELAGQPLNNGSAIMSVSANVKDSAEHTEEVTQTIPVAKKPIKIALVPESGNFVPGVENQVYVVTSYPDGRPAPAKTTLILNGKTYQTSSDALGISTFSVTPPNGKISATVWADGSNRYSSVETFRFADPMDSELYNSYGYYESREYQVLALSDLNTVLVRADKAIYDVGDTAKIVVLSTKKTGSVYIDAVLDGQTVLTHTVKLHNGRGELALDLSSDMAGSLSIGAYVMAPIGVPVRDTVNLLVRPASGLNVRVNPDKTSYRPGDNARLDFTVTDKQGRGVPAAVGVDIVDESVFSVEEQAPGLAALYFALQDEILKPRQQTKFFNDDEETYRQSYEDPFGTARKFQQDLLQRELQTGGELPGWDGDRRTLADARDSAMQRAAKVMFAYNSSEYEISTAAITQIEKDREIDRVQCRFDSDYNVYLWLFAATVLAMFIVGYKNKHAVLTISSLIATVNMAVIVIAVLYDCNNNNVYVCSTLLLVVSWIVSFNALFYIRPSDSWVGGWLKAIAALVPLLILAAILFPVFGKAREAARRGSPAGIAVVSAFGNANVLSNDCAFVSVSGAPPARVRQFFPETLYSNPAVITDQSGRGSVSLPIADSITSWRISAVASSKNGEVGSVNAPMKVFQEFFVDLDLPVGVTQGDSISVPVAVYNYLPRAQKISVKIKPEGWFEMKGEVTKEIELAANGVGVVYFPVRVRELGKHSLTVAAGSGSLSDAIRRDITVYPNGKEFNDVVNGILSGTADAEVQVPAGSIPGASRLFVKIFPGAFSQVVDGLDALLQVPYGCFEQTSSITYPNVLILKYLEAQKKDLPKVRMKAEQYISLGYQRLVTFEVPGGGFDWFGQYPANTMLSAYGIIELTDMADVSTVDKRLIDRARLLLESRQSKDGSWSPDAGTETWSQIDSKLTITAYVTWALSEGRFEGTDAVRKAQKYLSQHASEAKDPYTLALIANAFVASKSDSTAILSRLAELAVVQKDKASWASTSATLTYGEGGVAGVETTALAAYAFLKSHTHADLANKALNELVAARDKSGSWYTTQATILALKALLEGSTSGNCGRADVDLIVNGNKADTIRLTGDDTDVTSTIDLSRYIKPGINQVKLVSNGDACPAYQVVASYFTPWSHVPKPAAEPLRIQTKYSRLSVSKDGVVDAVATVKATGKGVKMAIVDLGLPPGFAPDTAGFEALKEKGVISKFEITPRQAVLYLRDINPGHPVTIKYSLRAMYPVKAVIPSNNAYDYYNPTSTHSSTKPVVIESI